MNRQILNEYLRSNERRPYRLGDWDCTLFVFDHILAQGGRDHFAAYRGKYSTYDEGVLLMKATDRVATVRGLTSKKLGKQIPLAFARTGDIVGFGNVVGILHGPRGIFLSETSGYERIPRALLDRAWSAGV